MATGVLLFIGAVLLAALRYGPDVAWNKPHAAFLGAVVAILIAAGITVGAMLRTLPSRALSAPLGEPLSWRHAPSVAPARPRDGLGWPSDRG